MTTQYILYLTHIFFQLSIIQDLYSYEDYIFNTYIHL